MRLPALVRAAFCRCLQLVSLGLCGALILSSVFSPALAGVLTPDVLPPDRQTVGGQNPVPARVQTPPALSPTPAPPPLMLRPPPVGASGRPILTLYGQDTREVYRCSGTQPGGPGGSHYTDLDCPAHLPQRVAMQVWLSRVGDSPPQAQPGPVRPAQRQGTESLLAIQP